MRIRKLTSLILTLVLCLGLLVTAQAEAMVYTGSAEGFGGTFQSK